MVFNNDILFIHIGKTGGMSTARYLCKVLKGPVYHTVPEDELQIKIGRATNIEGIRHETLHEALEVTKRYGKGVDSFQKVLATIRHPYDLELSLFHYLRALQKKGRKIHPKIQESLDKGFEHYVLNINYHRNKIKVQDYFTLNGRLPGNLHLIRFENLAAELAQIKEEFGSRKWVRLSHLNKIRRKISIDDLSPEIKESIYYKYQWVFDNGYYER